MINIRFPVIDPVATGANITRLRRERGLTVRDLQHFFGFEEPQAIYKWQRGQSLPSIDNLYALSALFHLSMNEILVSTSHIQSIEQQASACCSNCMPGAPLRAQGVWQAIRTAWSPPEHGREVRLRRGPALIRRTGPKPARPGGRADHRAFRRLVPWIRPT